MKDNKNFCRKCGSKDYIKYGDFIKIRRKIIQHLKCLNCGKCYKDER